MFTWDFYAFRNPGIPISIWVNSLVREFAVENSQVSIYKFLKFVSMLSSVKVLAQLT